MRRVTFVLAVLLCACAQQTRATFIVTANKIAGAGAARLQGWDIYQLSVQNDGTNGTSPASDTSFDVAAWDITITTLVPGSGVPAGTTAVNPAPFHFWNNGDFYSPNGQQIYSSFATGNTIANSDGSLNGNGQTDYNPGDGTGNQGNGSFIAVVGSVGTHRYTPNVAAYKEGQVSPSDQSFGGPFATTKTFRVAAAYSFTAAGFPTDRLTGVLRMGNVIVPSGAGFTLAGGFLDADSTSPVDAPQNQVSYTFGAAVPEPTTLGLVAVVGLALAGRRRRRAA